VIRSSCFVHNSGVYSSALTSCGIVSTLRNNELLWKCIVDLQKSNICKKVIFYMRAHEGLQKG
jgi:hypothetical protein